MGDKYYRSINPLPPSLSIQGNILSVDFMNALENLTITITDEQGTVIMEDNISGETGECITIILNNESTGRFYVKLEHQLGWLMENSSYKIIRYYSLSYASFRIKQYYIVDPSLL